ncbi:MAG: hypothetical protein KGN78_05725 [Actinomycetales bacterium]|nr:hypothetical protein [Actinomycetales bacterium]
MKWFTPKRRRWIYGISMALGPLLVFYGVVEGTAWPLWLAVAQQVLVPGMALNFVPGGDE